MAEPDEHVVGRYQKGDATAFDALYLRHRIATSNFILYLLGDRTAADDVHQDGWMSVVRSARDWKPSGSSRSWLYAILRNRSIDQLRRSGRYPVSDTGDEDEFPVPTPDPQPDPPLRLALSECIGNLNINQRQVFVLLTVQSLTFAEITEVMASRPGVANRRMQLAVTSLKRCLESKGIRGAA